ncbi:MAG: DNA polymerase-3 subunit delta' [Paraglaciecola sp.]|jgi:DNA polymerase-3 subunit delta'
MTEGDRIPHALLFLGPEGCGKLALAMAFSQYILCQNKVDGDACGQCASCGKASKYIHPDVHYSFPTVGSKVTSDVFLPEWRKAMKENPYLDINHWLQSIGAENKQGNITKDECTNIVKKLSLKTFESSKKFLIMWLPEYLGNEGNRLLKLIEEPPEDTHFILVAEKQELILNTILSRCQLVKINQLQDEEIVEGLVKLAEVAVEKAQSIAPLSDGNLNEALKMSESMDNDNANLFLDWLRKCYIGNGVDLFKWVEVFAKLGRENQKQFLKYGLHFMREYMALKMTGDDKNAHLQGKELSTAQNLTKVIEFDQIEKIVKLFTDCAYFVERNANPKVLFLDTSIQLNQILKRKGLND